MIVLSSTIPLIILGVFSLGFINNYKQAVIKNHIDDVLQSAEAIVNSSIETYSELLQVIPNDKEFQNSISSETLSEEDEQVLNRIMYSLMGTKSHNLDMHYVDANGLYIYSTATTPEFYRLPLYENWGIFRVAKENPNVSVYPNRFKYNNGFYNSLSLIKPVKDGQQVRGYLVLDVGTEMIKEQLNSVKGSSYGAIEFVITSSNNEVLYNDTNYPNPIKFSNNRFDINKLYEENNEEFIYNTRTDDVYQLTYYAIIMDAILSSQIRIFTILIFVGVLLVGLLTSIIGFFIGREISDPIVDLAKQIQDLESLGKKIDFDDNRKDEIGIIAIEFQNMLERLENFHIADLEKRDLLKTAEIKALLSQINPHFLYNTLDSIKWKAKLDETEDIAFMVTELSFLLKGSIDTDRTMVSVREELRFIESYINIQKLRYEDRFEYILDVSDEVMEYMIPKLILQPIVENALIHGIEYLDKTGIIKVTSWTEEEFLYFSISDNGLGSNLNFEELISNKDSEHIGLYNVDKRIKLYYGEEYGMRWTSVLNEGTTISIKLNKKVKGDL